MCVSVLRIGSTETISSFTCHSASANGTRICAAHCSHLPHEGRLLCLGLGVPFVWDIFLLWDPAWDNDPQRAPHPIHNKGEIQRLDNTVMHLVSNCADSLVCSVCQPLTNGNANYLRQGP